MVKIRLRRVGGKKQPAYRLVAADIRSPRDGGFLETLGHFNPRTEPNTLVINEERALYWLRHGAQPTPVAATLLAKLSIMDKFRKGGQEKSEEATPAETQPEKRPKDGKP